MPLISGSKKHHDPKLPAKDMAQRGKDALQHSAKEVISVYSREGKSLLNLHLTYLLRMLLAQSLREKKLRPES